ncbi:PREDICTED: uncharacterized protein ZC262.2 isoform X6 [Nicrophorus vespilloides]|uniref:Uncharacterized protein ZC262.2 isoform X6 n=1 Tax=Nicrophorus vespilloides TaxID=110193 RepID=A0ABM1NIU9_NICVS|nr:PREDICTED: uncharacterized protein ZC262.2 isoform X6 [Nicrophorus vespilloides]
MDKLANYGSDDDCEEESPKTNNSENEDRNVAAASTSIAPKTVDTNYDNVGMELSEESDGSMRSRHRSKSSERRTSRDAERERRFRTSPKYSRSTRETDRGDDDQRRRRDREDRRDRDDRRDREDRREREERRDRDDDRRDRDREDDRRDRERDDDRRDRDKDDERKNRGKDREDERRDTKYRRDKYRDDRRWRRSNSREKYRNKSPTSKRSRRSSSREKKYPAAKRFDKAAKLASLEKMGIDLKVPEEVVEKIVPQQQPATEPHVMSESKFFIPGVTGRLREQMEKRKQLWQKKPAEPERKSSPNPATSTTFNSIASSGSGSKTGKVWETTIFAQDQDGKQASKFKRLMGIREPAGGNGSNGAKPTDMVKKQEELFHTMEQQYEVARTATHTMRGVGLGFGSYQR